jgi:hypothetical protein
VLFSWDHVEVCLRMHGNYDEHAGTAMDQQDLRWTGRTNGSLFQKREEWPWILTSSCRRVCEPAWNCRKTNYI